MLVSICNNTPRVLFASWPYWSRFSVCNNTTRVDSQTNPCIITQCFSWRLLWQNWWLSSQVSTDCVLAASRESHLEAPQSSWGNIASISDWWGPMWLLLVCLYHTMLYWCIIILQWHGQQNCCDTQGLFHDEQMVPLAMFGVVSEANNSTAAHQSCMHVASAPCVSCKCKVLLMLAAGQNKCTSFAC